VCGGFYGVGGVGVHRSDTLSGGLWKHLYTSGLLFRMGLVGLQSVRVRYYELLYPRRVLLEDGGEVIISEEEQKQEDTLLVYVPSIYGFRDFLVSQGFSVVSPSTPMGEEFSLSKIVVEPWEHHIRGFRDGFVSSHVEVSRAYLEHLSSSVKVRSPVVYETLEYALAFMNRAHLMYRPSGKWVSGVLENYRVRLEAPDELTAWRPLVTLGLALGAMGVLAYLSGKLSKPEK